MSEQVLFAEGDKPAAPLAAPIDLSVPAQAPTLVVPADVADLIGEGKKYPTVEAALASIPHAQSHISTLEGENAEFQNRLMSNDKLDQVLEKLSAPAQPVVVDPTAPQPGISREDLSTLVQQEIAQTAKVNQQEANLATVESKLRDTHGESASEKFNTKATEIGMSPAQLTSLAKVAPHAVLALMGEIKPGASQPAPTSEGVNLATVGNIGGEPEKKNIMFGASTKDIVDEWKACAPKEED